MSMFMFVDSFLSVRCEAKDKTGKCIYLNLLSLYDASKEDEGKRAEVVLCFVV